jgi:hypothetical protein
VWSLGLKRKHFTETQLEEETVEEEFW